MGEALTLYHVMIWLSCLSPDIVDFVSNSKVTKYAFHQGRVDVTEFGQMIDTYRRLFITYFTNSKVEFSR